MMPIVDNSKDAIIQSYKNPVYYGGRVLFLGRIIARYKGS